MKQLHLERLNSILVICPNPLGDVVMATANFRSLRHQFPQASITLLLRPPLQELLAGAAWYDEILLYDRRKDHHGVLGWWRLGRLLRQRQYDAVIVFPNSIRSGLIARLSGAPIRIGYERLFGRLLLTHPVALPREQGKFAPRYMVHYYNGLTSLIGAPAESLKLELPLAEASRTQAAEIWSNVEPHGDTPKIVVIPGASFGSSKLWPSAYFAQLITRLGQEYRARFLIVAGPGEEAIVRQISQETSYPVTILPPRPGGLALLKGLIQQAQLLIVNDTGPRHIANAFGIPAIILMGPTSPLYTATSEERGVVLRHSLPCSPCQLKRCPYGHQNCLVGLLPDEVYAAARQFLPAVSG